ncbi:512_t:CDS:2 [Ambispora gerdemannii]|uniref:512_t:CDS:1 n=1 Tax=Ambispora gerdemannii TaxID=144530 RepID=A0A9N8YM55_9GLOM|nr:512_t:CDS:2 [Ambispora gerdemannii]
MEQRTIQLANIAGYIDGSLKKNKEANYFLTIYLTISGFLWKLDTSLILIQAVFTHKNIHEKAVVLAEADPNSQMCHLLQSEKKEQVNLFGSLSECFFEQFFHDSLDQNLIIVKSMVTTECDSSYCPKKVLSPEPYLCICGSEFKTTNGEAPKNISVNAYRIEKVTLVKIGETKNVYRCADNTTSTRQIDQQLPLILVINVTGISIDDEEVYLQNKDLPEKISFLYEDHVMTKRYHLAGVSYCNGNHHVADIYFEKTKNVGWY